MKGLSNLGNTCYMNSSLQMLLNIKDFCSIIMSNKEKDQSLRNFAEFIMKYHITNNGVIVPKLIKNMINKNEMFNNYDQHDSAEFLICFLEIIDNIIKKKNIYNKFEINEKTILKCKVRKCLYKSETINKRMFLFFPIEKKCNNLDDCYRLYKINEKLIDDNMWFCERCNKKRIASKRTEIIDWPNNLFIKLKRFDYNINGAFKNNKKINVPLSWRRNYKLKGGVIHNGNVGGGHYMYFGKYFNKWFLFNDSNVTEIDHKILNILKDKAYILNYYKE